MAISYPITLPTSPGFAAVSIRPFAAVAQSVSPFTGQQQTYVHPAQFLTCEISFPPMSRAEAAPVVAALMSLQGTRGTFYFGDPAWTSPQGVGTGTPLVNGGAQTGQDLITDGWTISQTGILKAGDWIQVGASSTRQLCMVLADTNSDGAGNATFSLFPRIRTAFADGTGITTTNPAGVWRLTSDFSFMHSPGALARGATISAVEAF